MKGYAEKDVCTGTISVAGMASAVFFAGLMIACSRISFHLWFTPVPITLQVLGMILSGLVLGSRLGALSQTYYVLAGAAGLPIFAEGKAGIAALLGPTGGYIVGFVVGAYVTGLIFERFNASSRVCAVVSGLGGLAALYALGVTWLAVWMCFGGKGDFLVTLRSALQLGVMPFIGVDLIKAVIASGIALGVSPIPGLAKGFSFVRKCNQEK